MDYHDSSAGNARLAVAKYAATASKKLGTIFFNPGMPIQPIVRGLSTNTQPLQVDPVVRESKSSENSDNSLVKNLRVSSTSYPGILVESDTQRWSTLQFPRCD